MKVRASVKKICKNC
ncbi:50S ribosomal protein L36, partial [Candidatus Binatus sp.]